MSIHGVLEYKRAKKRVDELKSLLIDLDNVADILYNNLSYSGVWSLIQHMEEIRLHYYIEYHDYAETVKNKGIQK